MKLPWRKSTSFGPRPEGLGFESIRFDTLGLTQQPDTTPNQRHWLGSNVGLAVQWKPSPPDFPSLGEDELRQAYQAYTAESSIDGQQIRALSVTVRRDTPLPAVCTLTQVRSPGDHGYAYVGVITLVLAECWWAIKVQCSEGNVTGMREAVALDRLLQEHTESEQSIEELTSKFDPYDEQWDSELLDSLTVVRRSMYRVLTSLEVDPAVRQAAPFLP